ncbi:hypothetical protein [Hymenobacter koreensis]
MEQSFGPRYVLLEKKLQLTTVLLRVWLALGAAATASAAALL